VEAWRVQAAMAAMNSTMTTSKTIFLYDFISKFSFLKVVQLTHEVLDGSVALQRKPNVKE
jgi:hypothetical protein